MRRILFVNLKLVSLLFLFTIFYSTVFAVDIIETESVTISATVPGIVVPGTGGGGGGSTEVIKIPETAVQFSGLAYPFAPVTVTKQGKQILTVKADDQGVFSATLAEKYDSTLLYSVQAQDLNGVKSLLLNYPIVVRSGYLTHLSGILFAPTIVLDKSEALLGDFITLSGYALPNKEIIVSVNGASDKNFTLRSNPDGSYSMTAPLIGMPKGEYTVSLHYNNDSRMSKLVKFIIGDKNVLNQKEILTIPGDCNKDNIINLVDFSVLAFWYKKPNPPICVDTNADKTVNLVDFSILAFYWTG